MARFHSTHTGSSRLFQLQSLKLFLLLLGTFKGLMSSYDHTIRFWEALSGICIRTIQHPDSVNKLAISPDKRVLAVAGNPSVCLYDVQSNNPNPVRQEAM